MFGSNGLSVASRQDERKWEMVLTILQRFLNGRGIENIADVGTVF